MSSYLTVSDMFCGAGGSSQGAAEAGATIIIAGNHWRLAIETHNTNFPKTDHDCADINQVDPRRWPTTDLLWASPECTNHSVAKGRKRRTAQLSFDDDPEDPAAIRSRATMWDVPRFAEYHDYRAIIVENVVDAAKWRLFSSWLHAMRSLDYNYRICYLNSMFFGAPQSRDRMYVVFWKKGLPSPDLEHQPVSYCDRCEKLVAGVQSFKKSPRWGRYRSQYVYRCPHCSQEVSPAYAPAFIAIDWSDPGERIGDRKRPLRPRTMDRIRQGLDKFGGQWLVLETAYSHAENNRSRPVLEAMMTQTSRQTMAISGVFLSSVNYFSDRPRSLEEPLPTQTTAVKNDITIPPSAAIVLRQHAASKELAEPLTTITAGGNNHGLLQMPWLMLNYSPGYSKPISEPMGAITTTDHHSLVQTEPFLLTYYRSRGLSPVGDAMPTICTLARHGVVQPIGVSVEDCYFRMLKPDEIGRGMAFRDDYIVLGNKRDQVRQYGNAVTPPVSAWLFSRLAAVM